MLLLKSEIKNKAGYALYGNPPRWHQITKDGIPSDQQVHYQTANKHEIKAVEDLKSAHNASNDMSAEAKVKHVQTAADTASKQEQKELLLAWQASVIAGKKPTKEQEAALATAEKKHPEATASWKAKVLAEAAPKADQLAAMIDKLYLPDTNTNAKTVNKKLDKLKELVAAGDVAALKDAKWGSNTYGKKIAQVAEKIASLLGSGEAPSEMESVMTGIEAIADSIENGQLSNQFETGLYNLVSMASTNGVSAGPAVSYKSKLVYQAFGGSSNVTFGLMGTTANTPDGTVGLKLQDGSIDYNLIKELALKYQSSYLPQLPSNTDPNHLAAYIDMQLAKKGVVMPVIGSEAGPKEGDTKEVNGVTYVLQGGRWHKQAVDEQSKFKSVQLAEIVANKYNDPGSAVSTAIDILKADDLMGWDKAEYYKRMKSKWLYRMLGGDATKAGFADSGHVVVDGEIVGDYLGAGGGVDAEAVKAIALKYADQSLTEAHAKVLHGLDLKLAVEYFDSLLADSGAYVPAVSTFVPPISATEVDGKLGMLAPEQVADSAMTDLKAYVEANPDLVKHATLLAQYAAQAAGTDATGGQFVKYQAMFLNTVFHGDLSTLFKTDGTAHPYNQDSFVPVLTDDSTYMAQALDPEKVKQLAWDYPNASKTQAALQSVHTLSAKAAAQYFKDAYDKMATGVKPAEEGPKEGDTKVVDGIEYVLQGGKWHRVTPKEEAKEETKPYEFQTHKIHLTNTIAGHNKFYTLVLKGSSLMASYGKIGKQGTTKDYSTISPGSSYSKAYDQLNNKLKGGYQVVDGDYKEFLLGAHADVQAYSLAMKAHGSKATPTPAPEATPAPAPEATPTSAPAADGLAGMLDIAAYSGHEVADSWTKLSGAKGSNPGGLYEDHNGDKWYIKTPKSADHVMNELLAVQLYKFLGINTPEVKTVEMDGKLSIASKWIGGLSNEGEAIKDAPGAVENYVIDAWLGNYDAVGTGYDNLLRGPDGNAVRIDAGGALIFRAQGAPKKDFGDTVDLDSLLNPSINSYTASIFGGITQAQKEHGAALILGLEDADIKKVVEYLGPGDKKAKTELARKLIARKADIAKQFPGLKPMSAIPVKPFDPSRVAPPPDFLNWGGSGKPGPSSIAEINQSNYDATQAIYAVAKTGDVDAISQMMFPKLDKATQEVIGEVSASDHPSQHVSSYAKQAIEDINNQTAKSSPNITIKVGTGNGIIENLSKAFAIVTDIAKTKLPKIGEYIRLGVPGRVNSYKDILDLPKKTLKAGTLDFKKYAAKSREVTKVMPASHLDAIQAYTGNSSGAINKSMWAGNPTGKAAAAMKGMKNHAYELEPGTVLSRKLSVDPTSSFMAQLLKSEGSIIQETGMSSTSIDPNAWSGNVHLKMHIGPGVKGLYVDKNTHHSGGCISHNCGPNENEMLLPQNCRMFVTKVTKKSDVYDEDGFGGHGRTVIEVVVLPTED